MLRLATFLMTIILVAGLGTRSLRAGDGPAIEAMLREAGVDARDVGIQETDLAFMIGQRAQRSEIAALVLRQPLRADGFARVLAFNVAHSAAVAPQETLGQLSVFNSQKLFRGLVGDPTEAHKAAAKQPGALAAVLGRCGAAADFDAKALETVPAGLQEAAAYLLAVELDAAEWVKRSQAGAPEAFWVKQEGKLREPLLNGPQEDEFEKQHPDPEFDLQQKHVIEQFPASLVIAGGQDLVTAVPYAMALLKADAGLAKATFDVRIQTRRGWVVLADARDQQHTYEGGTLLIVDVGGNDYYTNAGANAGRAQPVSVCLDLGGNDTSTAAATGWGSFGAGVMGIGMLWDDGGDDTYEGDRRSQGAGLFGVGVLIDNAGKDNYKAVDFAQGAALAGYGLLIDRAGSDRYESYRNSQAYASPNAGAALVDLAGDDAYIANDGDIRYPAPQSKEHNVSMSQGAATGFRADYTDGISINGGAALLFDGGGNDTYTCGVFGQGVGYWQGLGLLIDAGGDDSYAGMWYVQGAAAHYAAGMLLDLGGNDHYSAAMNMAQGAGHDLSEGILIDDAGDDVYDAPSLALGASNAAGIGLFVDRAGSDKYHVSADSSLGWVSRNEGYRGLMRSYGLFFDLGGKDEYSGRGGQGAAARAEAGDGKSWVATADPNAVVPYLFGFGFDR